MSLPTTPASRFSNLFAPQQPSAPSGPPPLPKRTSDAISGDDFDLSSPLADDVMNAGEEPVRDERDNTNHDNSSRSPLLRFFDAFLQEKNIKWVLGIGTLLLLGSSLMLVASHWQNYAPVWKQLAMLGYTAVIAGASFWTYHRLGLQKTGTTLMALTVLLLPVMFLALHWVQGTHTPELLLNEALTRDGPGLLAVAMHIAILAAAGLLAYLAASRIFRHFLHQSQPTFLACYLALCLAGPLLPLLPTSGFSVAAATLALWAIFSIGTVKVNRHVFWLVEEQHSPRITGFFPIALLGGQFLTLFALHLYPSIALPWVGLGCVMVSATVLLTADTVARVFQQRTGDLVRPLPVAIIAPLVVGLILCAAGVVLAATGIAPGGKPYSLVPTAAIAATLMLVVARRTRHSAFVWAGLIGVTIAYQFSPVFFRELVMQLMSTSAKLVNEEKLPPAFYGLTYLPLIAGLMIASTLARKRGALLFAAPTQKYATALSVLLLAISTTHVKAMAPVAAAMVVVFALQTSLSRNPRVAIFAVIAFVTAAFGAAPCIEAYAGLALPWDMQFICICFAAVALMVPGGWIDRQLTIMCDEQLETPEGGVRGLTPPYEVTPYAPCRVGSLLVTFALAGSCAWGYVRFAADMPAFASLSTWVLRGLPVIALLAIQAMRFGRQPLAYLTLAFAYLVAIAAAFVAALPFTTITSLLVFALIAQWLIAGGLKKVPTLRASRVFAVPASRISETTLLIAMFLFTLGASSLQIVSPSSATVVAPWWVCRALLLVWTAAHAIRTGNPRVMLAAALGTLATSGALLVTTIGANAYQWLPALWAATAAATLPVIEIVRRTGSERLRRTVTQPLEPLVLVVLGAAALLSLTVFTLPFRVAGGIALAGLLALGILRKNVATRVRCFALANWQIIALVVLITGPAELNSVLDFSIAAVRNVCIPVALAAALSVLPWQRIKPGQAATCQIASAHRAGLRIVAFLGVALAARFTNLGQAEFLDVAVIFAVLIVSELRSACRDQKEQRVWNAEILAGLCLGFFVWHGVITFGAGISLFATLATGVLLAGLARVAALDERSNIMVRPFRRTALAMPMLTIAIGLVRHVAMPEPTWLGMNSLALLLAGGFYFWHGIQHKQRRFIVLAGGILNVALALLWNELALTDPQFFLIPLGMTILGLTRLMKREIPSQLREPLNYLGALVILVSPTFHILGQSWLPMVSLMLLSVLVILAAIGFRVRPLVYTGTAFLVADLIAMIVRGSMLNPSVLWLVGIALGAAVVTLGAFAEKHREQLLARIRAMSAAIAAWD